MPNDVYQPHRDEIYATFVRYIGRAYSEFHRAVLGIADDKQTLIAEAVAAELRSVAARIEKDFSIASQIGEILERDYRDT